ncbi:MAG TPA: MBL fold metallo-hydrolase [Acidimicrobiales bacterium]|nr:MBL fold metallo-hydrolase [Acidimicrobiales bacterium]
MLNVEIIATSELGDRSYVVHDDQHAIVIDPQRDIDRIEHLLDARRLTLAIVLETHIHNDYVTGGLALSAKRQADYGIAAEANVDFSRKALADGDVLEIGTLKVEIVATPGHTDNHLAFIVEDDQGLRVLFSGGSLLYGSVGRTDLLGSHLTEELSRAQFRSAHDLAARLDDAVALYPTHGFGSFCSSGNATGGDASTVGIERMQNDVFLAPDEDTFVKNLIANLSEYPSYYTHMGPLNLIGPDAPELGYVNTVDPDELGARIRSGEWVIDLREADLFAIHHLSGTLSITVGNSFSTYVGWLIPWDARITLIAEGREELLVAQRQLVRIGIDQRMQAAVGAVENLASGIEFSHYPSVVFADVPADGSVTIVDVRRHDEREERHIVGSIHLSIVELAAHMQELPKVTLWVHCASGFRASIASSMLARAGFDVVLINDDFSSAANTRLVLS